MNKWECKNCDAQFESEFFPDNCPTCARAWEVKSLGVDGQPQESQLQSQSRQDDSPDLKKPSAQVLLRRKADRRSWFSSQASSLQ